MCLGRFAVCLMEGSFYVEVKVNAPYKLCKICGKEHTDQQPHDIQGIRQQSHYTQHKIQPVVYIGENRLDFLAGNVIKYVSRYNLKNGVEDLEKARHYLDMLIQREKKEPIKP